MTPRWCAALLAAGLLLMLAEAPQAAEQRLLIAPRLTDARLPETEAHHLVIYNADRRDAPLLIWLSGTGGNPAAGPQRLYETALRQGYRLLALSYVNTPAVAQVCVGPTLRTLPDCAGQFRQQRAWGQAPTRVLADRPEDAIVPRLVRLLQHLARNDASGDWMQYLDGEEPRWQRLVLAGQSQGGGMAAFIAQTRQVAGVILFSGGWDRRAGGGIAHWYSRPSQTPPQLWHASFHTLEPQAAAMAQIYRELGIPQAQVHALSEPVIGAHPHGEGISNPAYRAMWEQMLQPAP